ncbi:MAG TPA: Hsp20/alpha crystallin family protein [Verrucomicrobia bacterium]|nr:Hsp20/alpha crystallin family protein [Verrucomicrobiota bacterium]HOP97088.1 Hsp20/alpha crystallin family protein [Verrucomicrobiota bacterium]
MRRQRPNDWTPLARLRDQIDRMFDQPMFGLDMFGGWNPAVDVLEDKDKLVVKAELPGFKREDLNVTLQGDHLVLSGERKFEEEKQEAEFYRSERFYGRFHRAIPLPFSVEQENIQARYKDGVLTVTLPKSEKSRGRQIEVAVE